jgi:hypothetical protein
MQRNQESLNDVVELGPRQALSDAHVGLSDTYPEAKHRLGPCLFVSREMGAGGGQIARRVSESLGWEVLDKGIVETLASQYGTPRVVLDAVDEKKVGWLADMFNGWIEGHGFSQLSYVHRLGHLFNMAATRGNIVIVGRGARFMLPRKAGLSVRIVAPFNFRVEQVILRKGLAAADAHKLVAKSDLDRQAFIKTYFHQQIANPHTHDLIVNVEQLVQEDAVSLIVDAVHAWLKKSGFSTNGFKK